MNRIEDPLTEALATLLRSNDQFLQWFLYFLIPDKEKASAWARLPLLVETQHSFADGRIDLLLHADSLGIIVECKVAERPRIHQMNRYYDYWVRSRRTEPLIYWLARKLANPKMGRSPHLTRELLWEELWSKLLQARISAPGCKEQINVFCRQIELAGALLSPGERKQWQVRSRGYDACSIESFFDEIVDRLGSAFDCRIIPPTGNADHRLRVGRKSWIRKFTSGNVRRVELRVKPRGTDCDFGLSGSITLYSKGEEHDLVEDAQGFPHRAAICYRAGLRIRRSEGAKWNRTVDLIGPRFLLTPPVKHAAADDPDLENNPVECWWSARSKALAAAEAILMRFCGIVEQF